MSDAGDDKRDDRPEDDSEESEAAEEAREESAEVGGPREVRPQSVGGGVEVPIALGGEDDFEGLEGLTSLPDILPVLPLKNTVLFPFLLSPLLVSTPRSQKLIDDVLLRSDRLMLCTAVRHEVDGSPGPDDVYEMGTILRIVKMLKFPDDSYRLLVQGVRRARIVEFTSEDPYLSARIASQVDSGDTEDVNITALMRNVSQRFSDLISQSPRLSEELEVLASNLEDPSKLADLVASNLDFDVPGKQRILEECDVERRLQILLDKVIKETDALKIEAEIKEKVQNEMGQTQREYMLRQQLEAIRRELGEADDGTEEVEQLRERIDAAGLPEEAQKQADRELDRLAQTPSAAAEHSVIRTYLEWMADLPWSESSQDQLDVVRAREVLDEDHYGLDKVKERIIEYIAVLSLKRDLKGPILCLAGPPGTGKTSLGRSVARALDRKFARLSLGGVRDEAEIRGHRRTYVGAMPGRIVQSLKKAGTNNPVFLLDEVDKVGADNRGDPSAALLEVLDPEQNDAFSDHYLEVPFDLSRVLFIATANIMDPVPAALRDRMEVIELPGYTLEEKLEIAKGFLIPRQLKQNGIDGIDFELPTETVEVIIERYTRESGVRNLEREIGGVCRKIARRVAEGTAAEQIRIGSDDLFELLGPAKAEPELAEREGRPGVAVGLAYTPTGGDILFIESTKMPGHGELQLTGSLGEVMRESVEAARTWIRAHSEEMGLEQKSFDETDLHLHVPSGAVPKDGPSAGIAMVTSLTSLFTGRPPKPRVAMTGEITLRGKVLPVGGIKAKVLAAKRAGIETVVLPEPNKRDVEEIPQDLLAGLDVKYVERIDEALEYTLGPATG